MRKAQHTPGPWIAEQRSWGYPKTEGGPIVRAWDVRSESGIPVACGTIADENEANARLIAATPDLLLALRELTRAASAYGNEHGVSGDLGARLSDARAAIRKAGS